ncbi:hypothetical protein D3C80_1005160 [compost metagenome]
MAKMAAMKTGRRSSRPSPLNRSSRDTGPPSATGSAGRMRQAVTAISNEAATAQTMTASDETRVNSAPMARLATTKAAEPQPRGRENAKPSRPASRRVITSLSGIRAAAAVAPTSQNSAQGMNPSTRPAPPYPTAMAKPSRAMGVRRRTKPSAQTASNGPVRARASMGMASRAPIWAPLSPWSRNHRPANGRVTPLALNSRMYCRAMRGADVIGAAIADFAIFVV